MTGTETGYDTGSMGDLGQPLCVCSSHHCKPCQQYWLCGTLVICVYVCVCVCLYLCLCVCLHLCTYLTVDLSIVTHLPGRILDIGFRC